MLYVIQNRASAWAKSYYAHSDYLSEDQELTRRWGAWATQILGLAGEVEKQSFDRLCDNLDPRSGKQLTLRTNSDRTVGYNFNFHLLKKGVSLAYRPGRDARILDAFRESVEETIQELEQEAKTRVRKHGASRQRRTRSARASSPLRVQHDLGRERTGVESLTVPRSQTRGSVFRSGVSCPDGTPDARTRLRDPS